MYGFYFDVENCEHGTVAQHKQSNITQHQESTSNEFRVYPNPAKEQVFFARNPNNSNFQAQLIITDITGKVVYQDKIQSEILSVIWNASNISNGLYFYQWVENGTATTSGEITIQH